MVTVSCKSKLSVPSAPAVAPIFIVFALPSKVTALTAAESVKVITPPLPAPRTVVGNV